MTQRSGPNVRRRVQPAVVDDHRLFGSASGAAFDADRSHRLALWRDLGDPDLRCLFVMLNPSTADATANDPTIVRCIGFARAWGYGALDVANLFAFRSTEPSGLQSVGDPVGAKNDAILLRAARRARLVVCAWGSHRQLAGLLQDRAAVVTRKLLGSGIELYHLGLNADGQPRHPLYLPASTRPERWVISPTAATDSATVTPARGSPSSGRGQCFAHRW